MKISFDDGSYLEFIKSNSPNKVIVTIAAKHPEDDLAIVANSVEITETELKNLLEKVLK